MNLSCGIRPAAVMASLVLWSAAPAASGPTSPIRPYYAFVHWMSMGRPELALEQFAEDAIVVAGPRCTAEHPCVGRDQIRDRYLADLVGRVAVLPLTANWFDGRTLHTRGGPVLRGSFDGGEVSWQPGHAITMSGDRITALRVEWVGAPRQACR